MYDSFNGVDFRANLADIDTLDYGTFHLYPELWGYDYVWGSRWIKEHDIIGEKVCMPRFPIMCMTQKR